MQPIELSQTNYVVADKAGVGRCNLFLALLLKSDLLRSHPESTAISVGVHKPESGRTDIHPAVITVAQKRFGIDISQWRVTLLDPTMVNERTIVIWLCEPEFIPSFVTKIALDVLLAPISDPFGDNIEANLQITATQLAYYEWLLCLTLNRRFDEIGINRTSSGAVASRHLNQFEPKNIDPEYRFDQYFANAYR